MTEIEIHNFQSIEKVSFAVEGFTALVGKSNIGKSAVVRAIECALTGAAGTDFVRHGKTCERRLRGNKKCKCHASVRIKTTKIELLWEKGDAVNQYEVTLPGGEPKVYSSVDRGTPEFLEPDFSLVKIGTKQELIQVSGQFSPIFLLNQTGNTVADVLSDVARLDDINTAMRLVVKDRKNAVSTRKVREKDVVSLKEDLDHYAGLDGAVIRVGKVEQMYEAVGDTQLIAAKLERYIKSWVGLASTIKSLETATAPELPDVEKLALVSSEAVKLSRFYDEVVERLPVVRKLKGVSEVELPTIQPIKDTQQELVLLEGWLERLRVFKEEFSRWDTLTKLPITDKEPIVKKTACLETIQVFVDHKKALERTIQESSAKLQKLEVEEQSILDEFKELGICPTCSQQIDANHSHAVGE
jgi:hypothetical protein